MVKRILVRLLLANILATAIGFSGHCLHTDLDHHDLGQASVHLPDDCDHCFFCTGAGEASTVALPDWSMPVSRDVRSEASLSVRVFDLSIDLPPKS